MKIGIIFAVLKHSGKIPSDSELLKSIEIVGAIRGARILYINTGIFMRSVDLLFCLQFLHYQRGQKGEFSMGAPRKYNGEVFELGISQSRLEAKFEK